MNYRVVALRGRKVLSGLASLSGCSRGGKFWVNVSEKPVGSVFVFDQKTWVVPLDATSHRVQPGWYQVEVTYSHAAIIVRFIGSEHERSRLPVGAITIAVRHDLLKSTVQVRSKVADTKPLASLPDLAQLRRALFLSRPLLGKQFTKESVTVWLTDHGDDSPIRTNLLVHASAIALHLNRIHRRSGSTDLAVLMAELLTLRSTNSDLQKAMRLQREKYHYSRNLGSFDDVNIT